MEIRKITTITEEILTEGGKEVDPVINIAVVAAVIKPWHGQGFVETLAGIDEVASDVVQFSLLAWLNCSAASWKHTARQLSLVLMAKSSTVLL